MVTGKHVRPEIPASNAVVSHELDGGPPQRVDKDSVVEPVPNGLLAYSSAFAIRGRVRKEELTDTARERLLPSSDLNSPPQRGNVVFLHDRILTRIHVPVNKDPCLTSHKETCTLLVMQQTKKRPHAPPIRRAKGKAIHEPEVGPDGLTMPQRVIQLMTENGVGQNELARMCSERYAVFVPGSEEKVKQQHIFNLLKGPSGKGQSSAWFLPLIAAVFDVSDMWLQFGIGKKERKLN
jgi:hypothetical protein